MHDYDIVFIWLCRARSTTFAHRLPILDNISRVRGSTAPFVSGSGLLDAGCTYQKRVEMEFKSKRNQKKINDFLRQPMDSGARYRGRGGTIERTFVRRLFPRSNRTQNSNSDQRKHLIRMLMISILFFGPLVRRVKTKTLARPAPNTCPSICVGISWIRHAAASSVRSRLRGTTMRSRVRVPEAVSPPKATVRWKPIARGQTNRFPPTAVGRCPMSRTRRTIVFAGGSFRVKFENNNNNVDTAA